MPLIVTSRVSFMGTVSGICVSMMHTYALMSIRVHFGLL